MGVARPICTRLVARDWSSNLFMAFLTTYSFSTAGKNRRDSERKQILVLLTASPNPQL